MADTPRPEDRVIDPPLLLPPPDDGPPWNFEPYDETAVSMADLRDTPTGQQLADDEARDHAAGLAHEAEDPDPNTR